MQDRKLVADGVKHGHMQIADTTEDESLRNMLCRQQAKYEVGAVRVPKSAEQGRVGRIRECITAKLTCLPELHAEAAAGAGGAAYQVSQLST